MPYNISFGIQCSRLEQSVNIHVRAIIHDEFILVSIRSVSMQKYKIF